MEKAFDNIEAVILIGFMKACDIVCPLLIF